MKPLPTIVNEEVVSKLRDQYKLAKHGRGECADNSTENIDENTDNYVDSEENIDENSEGINVDQGISVEQGIDWQRDLATSKARQTRTYPEDFEINIAIEGIDCGPAPRSPMARRVLTDSDPAPRSPMARRVHDDSDTAPRSPMPRRVLSEKCLRENVNANYSPTPTRLVIISNSKKQLQYQL